MKNWRGTLGEILDGEYLDGSPPPDREVLIDALGEFADELRRNRRTVVIEARADAIGFAVNSTMGLEMEMVIETQGKRNLSIFSNGVIVANFNSAHLQGLGKEAMLEALAVIYAGAIPVQDGALRDFKKEKWGIPFDELII